MSHRIGVLGAGVLLLVLGRAEAQVRTVVRAQTFYESYTFDPGYTFDKTSEFAVPVGLDLSFGRRVDLSLSSGYASVDVTGTGLDSRVSGMLDTELRLGYNLVPGRLIAVVTGRVPTGVRVDTSDVLVLTALGSDQSSAIGFAIPTLGAGGSLGGGLVGALQAGKFAVGLGVTYSYPFKYQPYADATTKLTPGSEVRARLGIEGAAARNTYVRFAGVFAARAKDELDLGGGDTPLQSGIGRRMIGYGEVVQGLGRMQLTLYAFDVYRGTPSVEGALVLPKGNLIAAGFRHAVPVSQSFSVTPRAEWRLSTSAPLPDGTTTTTGPLRQVGTSFRIGLDARQAFTPGVSVTLSGSGLFGSVRPEGGSDISMKGWRAGLTLHFTP